MVALTDRLFPHIADPMAEWRVDYQKFKAMYQLFQKEEAAVLYQNEYPDENVLRQHELLICSLISQAQQLVLHLSDSVENNSLRKDLDDVLEKLRDSFNKWHGEIPESFKQAMEDVEAGRLVDMETALSVAPSSKAK